MLALFLHCFGSAWGQTKKPVSFAELAAYTGADREQRLLAGAKTEGEGCLVHFTGRELVQGTWPKASRSKYSGIKIEPYRGTSSDIMTKVTAEARAKQIIADVIETTLPTLRVLAREQTAHSPIHRLISPNIPNTKESAARGCVFGAIDRETYMGVGYQHQPDTPRRSCRKITAICSGPSSRAKSALSQRNRNRTLGGILQSQRRGVR